MLIYKREKLSQARSLNFAVYWKWIRESIFLLCIWISQLNWEIQIRKHYINYIWIYDYGQFENFNMLFE